MNNTGIFSFASNSAASTWNGEVCSPWSDIFFFVAILIRRTNNSMHLPITFYPEAYKAQVFETASELFCNSCCLSSVNSRFESILWGTTPSKMQINIYQISCTANIKPPPIDQPHKFQLKIGAHMMPVCHLNMNWTSVNCDSSSRKEYQIERN